jgi:peptidoglycan/LPS O-acetylase OafA/YrhL
MHPKYRPDIDGLRAVAVASVVAYHAFPWLLPGGFIGVDIFFVISGFLITTILLQSQMAGDFSYRDFYARRIRRIFPALVLVLAATLLFGWYVLLSGEFSQLGKQITGGAAFVANFVFWGESGYFDTAAETKPLLHLWSLGIEEQFYIFWPLLLGLAWRRRWPILRVILAIAVLSFLVNVLMVHSHRAAAFYSPASRAWELMVGGILACMRLRTGQSSVATPWRSHLQSVVGVGLIVLGLVTTRSDKAFPGWWALLPTLGAVSCIAAGPKGVLNRYLLSSRPMVWIGLISYPLYLWHWPLLVYARIVVGGELEPSAGIRGAMVLAAVLLAWATYRFAERYVKTHPAPGMLRALAGTGAAVAVAGLVIFAGLPQPRNNSPALQAVADAMLEDNYYQAYGEDGIDGQFVYRLGGASGSGNGRRTVLLIGDSHMQQYAPRAAELLGTAPAGKGPAVIFATKGSCAPVPGLFTNLKIGCNERTDAVLKLALEPQFDSVVIGACWACYFTGTGAASNYFSDGKSVHPFVNGDGIERSLASLQQVLQALSAQKKKRVYLLLGNPVGIDFDPTQLMLGSRLTHMSAITGVSTVPLPEDQRRLNERLKRVAAAAGAEVIEPIASLCSNGRCLRTMPDGTPAYKDIGHLRPKYTQHFARYIDPVFLDGATPAPAK